MFVLFVSARALMLFVRCAQKTRGGRREGARARGHREIDRVGVGSAGSDRDIGREGAQIRRYVPYTWPTHVSRTTTVNLIALSLCL